MKVCEEKKMRIIVRKQKFKEGKYDQGPTLEELLERTPEERERRRRFLFLIIILLILLMMLGIFACKISDSAVTAVILPTDEEVHDTDVTGTVRISVEPVINIKNGTMQDLNFFNTNKNRLLSIKIYTQDGDKIKDLVYTSPKIKTGMAIAGDFIDTSKLTKGINKAMVEVNYYDMEEKFIGQTNVKNISLLYES